MIGEVRPGVVGWIDAPIGSASVQGGSILVRGWAFIALSPVSRVEVLLDGRLIGRAGLHRFRPDVADAFEDVAAELAGFEFAIDQHLLDHAQDRTVVTARIISLDGTAHDLQPVDVTVADECMAAAPFAIRFSGGCECNLALAPSPGGKVRVLVFARSLDFGGSQLRMKELIQYLQGTGQFETVVVAPLDGPLREAIEAAGATVHVVRMPTHSLAAYAQQVEQCAAWAEERFDIVLAFTLSSFFGIDVAERLRLPSVWRIGENEPVTRVYEWLGQGLDRAVELRARRAFSSASVVAFVSESTRRSHGQHGPGRHLIVLRNGVDVVEAGAYVRSSDRQACRERLHIGDRRVLICAATFWPVKGPALLISALEHVYREYPQLECVIIGQHSRHYAEALHRLVARGGLTNCVRLVPYTHDLRPWWRAADIAVCPSESEALPTSVLEAMAFGLPVLASRVGGLPEVVHDGVTGWLAEPSDLGSWIAGLKRVAGASAAELRRFGEAAMIRVARDHDRRDVLSRTAALISDVARGSLPSLWSATPV